MLNAALNRPILYLLVLFVSFSISFQTKANLNNFKNKTYAYETKLITPNSAYIHQLKVADIDSDSDQDIAVITYDNLYLQLNMGSNQFSNCFIADLVPEDTRDLSQRFYMELADTNQDSKTDIIIADIRSNTVTFYQQNDSKCNFKPHSVSVDISGLSKLEVLDLDADGDLDLIAILDSQLVWFKNDEQLNFTKTIVDDSNQDFNDLNVIDIDLDGDLDLLSGDLTLYLNDGEQNFMSRTLLTPTQQIDTIAVLDFDRDGDLDIVTDALFENSPFWLENDGEEGFGTQKFHNADPSNAENPNYRFTLSESFHLLDLDLDGDSDLISFDGNNHFWFENQGDNVLRMHYMFSSYYSWQDADDIKYASVDLNQDTATELLLTISSRTKWVEFNTFYIDEHETFVNQFPTFDEDAIYSVSGPDSDALTIDANGKLSLIQPATFYHDEENKHQNILNVAVSLTYDDEIETRNFIIKVSDVDESQDYDQDQIPDYLDTDDDNDGISDEIEREQKTDPKNEYLYLDRDKDSVPDSLEGAPYSDGNIAVADALDQDSDSIIDYIEDNNYGRNDAPFWKISGPEIKQTLLTTKYSKSLNIIGQDLQGNLVASYNGWLSPRVIRLNEYGYENLAVDLDADYTLKTIVDLDKDGDLDFIGYKKEADILYWHENLGENQFTSHETEISKRRFKVVDLNGDGSWDISTDIYHYYNDGEENFIRQPYVRNSLDSPRVDLTPNSGLEFVDPEESYSHLVWREKATEDFYIRQFTNLNTEAYDSYSFYRENNAGILLSIPTSNQDNKEAFGLLSFRCPEGKIYLHDKYNEEFRVQVVGIIDECYYSKYDADLNAYSDDIDQDGFADLIVVNRELNRVAIYKNDNNTQFNKYLIVTDIEHINTLQILDVDNDGVNDLITHGDYGVYYYPLNKINVSSESTFLNTVRGEDLDGENVSISLVTSTHSDLFEFDSASGLLSLKQPITNTSQVQNITYEITLAIESDNHRVERQIFIEHNTDTDADGKIDKFDLNDDNDHVNDEKDALPLDSSETRDFDRDGIGDNADLDDDNDGVNDEDDRFRFNADEWLDTDRDGIGNNADEDDDNDGVADEEDLFPLDRYNSKDHDGDGIGDRSDDDDDNDGIKDIFDRFPFDPSESKDSDYDGIGNNADNDDDNDGVLDADDAFPLRSSEHIDTDGDGIGNNADYDDDNDGVVDESDAFPLDASRSVIQPEPKEPEKKGSGGVMNFILPITLLILFRRFKAIA